MINVEDKQKIKDDVERSFIERMRSAILEKITYCTKKGLSKDEASHIVTQAVKNLSNNLLPLLEGIRERANVNMVAYEKAIENWEQL